MRPAFRTAIIVVAAILVGASVSVIMSAEEQKPPESTQLIKQLTDRIASLESRVTLLEQQSRAQARVVIQPHAGPVVPGTPVPLRRLPEGWRQGEINGIPYYVVPLNTP